MPIVNVHIMQGHTPSQKTKLLENMTQAIVDSIQAPLATVRIVLQEIPKEHVIVGGQIGHDMARATVELITGRTPEQKAALIAAMANSVEQSIGLSTQHVRIILNDMPKTDLGVAGGKTALAAGR
jgi:4-oxalocrotonate tautomerase family enzyme